MKRYQVRILMQGGTTQHWITENIEARSFHTSERGYYYFETEDSEGNSKSKYYPINNTIVEEL